ncbi:MAG: hypothetical protein EOP53_17735 [Sphingobacteriales bacterium]|nr:MAG: hypothetical protein EOP53_17735 [Sphingobacteriales bacterium]
MLVSCSSDNDAQSRFTWSYKGVTYNASYTFASSVEDLGPNIIGGLGNSALSPGSGLMFKVIPLTPGVYTVGIGTFYAQFIDVDGNVWPVTGSLTITGTSNKRLHATFSLDAASSGVSYPVTGNIENLPITP